METNLARLSESAHERLGDYPSVWFEGTWYRSADLRARAARVATGLRERGVRPGDRVVVIMANCPEVGITYNAVWRAGAVVTPVIFLVSAPELRHAVENSGAVLIVTTAEVLPKVKEATEGLDLPVFVVGANYAELEAADPGGIVERAPDDLAALMYTGGTTGRSKGVALSHRNLAHVGAASRKRSHVEGLTRGLLALPLSHSYGLLITVGGFYAEEHAPSILMRWFEPQRWLELAVEHRAQVAAVVPSMLALLLRFPLESYDLSELRRVYCGAAPLSPIVAQEFLRRVPSVEIREGYGCTETAGLISSQPDGAPRLGTVGKPVDGVELRIIGFDGREVAAGEEGEIVVRGPNVMSHYWGEESAGDADGWLHTGDVGRLDDEGFLVIVDRMKDLIIRNGYNVFPRDVEDVLMTHPAVAMAAVIGRPDPVVGEEVVAFVALSTPDAVTPGELTEYAKERIAANKYPREVHIVDAIPLTSVGKLDRKRLRAAITR
ncbi:long-chain-fatty-acid--CoA ligase [Virgisporangium aliadipatigenens]|uniref:Long-chain-fatty-acid--CoA ligase n=1 Tax=Virgisporangium aliadipatigenens TaxID=741659 RepID=A0A8J3YLQ3_9ACTN|nr:AMP-binding protein [Virgisporangium aliadipatigenens]GIJ46428.1 long-chain-fatty-acid--CoA ligase [Virgisporangium aliadipatigenens]